MAQYDAAEEMLDAQLIMDAARLMKRLQPSAFLKTGALQTLCVRQVLEPWTFKLHFRSCNIGTPMVFTFLRQTQKPRLEDSETTGGMSDLAKRAIRRLARRRPRTWVPPGHYYSPIVDLDELALRRDVVFDRTRPPAGIELYPAEQLALIDRLTKHYNQLPFSAEKQPGLRYYYENPFYSYGDAILLSCLLMELRPKRFVEFGSGYSSCVTLDINEHFLNNELNCTFIDPYPKALEKLLSAEDRSRCRIVRSPAQDIDLGLVDALEAGDILFIDSTHVSKAGSDVNFHLFMLLPRLKPGVYIHFHDVFYPFEYPEEWFFKENRSWNELYVLRAFLMYNTEFKIVAFNHYLHLEHGSVVAASMPLFARNPGGGLWLQKR
ncbi:class I SAM-dependent methyltransferase [Microvirga sp. BT689]|uniref:class I SAM-dependent methyltransferase n=1 Tax=Microvirga arvi TaxID=2778731 RepID=UPI0019514ABF|nr:class I SAM-dependent methyltransferase [Microvirga arvi]MBM6583753.1 class I SAM-dependent methyltransferase [Microvirga arvi]